MNANCPQLSMIYDFPTTTVYMKSYLNEFAELLTLFCQAYFFF